MALEKLTGDQLASSLAQLPLWSINSHGKLSREFRFVDGFPAGLTVDTAAIDAEYLNHLADAYYVYNRVTFELTSHDAGCLTALDFTLAARIEARL